MAEKIEFQLSVSKDDLNTALVAGSANAEILNKKISEAGKNKQLAVLANDAKLLNTNFLNSSKTITSFTKVLNDSSKNALIASKSNDSLNESILSMRFFAKQAGGEVRDVFSQVNVEFKRVKESFIGNLGANAVTGAFSLLRSAIGETVTQAREFSRAIAEVNSILPKNKKLTEEQIQTFIKLSSLYGKNAQSEAKAFYEIVSGGVEDTATAFKILKQANEAATAGLTDVNVASKVLTSTFNAFAQQGTTVNQITDSLFQAVKDGQTTFEELAGTLGRVTPTAVGLGVSIDEVAGTIAFLTKSGIQTDQAITGLRATLSSVVKPSKEAADEANRLGIAFNATSVKQAGGFVNFLNQVRVATNGSAASIARLFGDTNAINTVIAIANGNFQDFTKTLESNKNSLGATASAAKELKNSFDFKAGQAEQSIKNLATSFSVFLLPALQTTLRGFRALTGIGNVSIEFDENRKKLKELALEYGNLKDRLKAYRADAFGKGSEAELAIEKRLNEILKERQKIRSTLSSQEITGIEGKPVDPIAEQTETERKLQTELLTIKKEFAASQLALDLELNNQRAIASGENFKAQQQIEFEQAVLKADAAYQAEILRNEASLRGKELGIANDIAFQKKKQKIDEANTKQEISTLKGQVAFQQLVQQKKNDILLQGLSFASSIAKDGSKEQFFIQKASALAQVAIARGQALAAIPAQTAAIPYPGNLAAAAQLISYANIQAALGAGIIAASAIKGYANGGIIGQGATMGGDNKLASVRDGEMVLNAEQQKNLFDMINGGAMGGEIVVQIDGREIARAVRSQINAGFKIA